MALGDIVVNRHYKCLDCEMEFVSKHALKDTPEECPHCSGKIIIKSGSSDIELKISNTRTLADVGRENLKANPEKAAMERKRKEDALAVAPWWRKNKHKVDLNILKDPVKYMETGKT